MIRAWAFICALGVAMTSCHAREAINPAHPADIDLDASLPAATGPITVETEMKHVALHAADRLVLNVERLRGTMVSRGAAPPVFDDLSSYVFQIADADVSMSMSSLQVLMNDYLLAYDGSPLTDVEVTADEGRLVVHGQLHKRLHVPISAKASVAATDDGRLRLRVESMKAIGIPFTGLLDLFGLEVEDVVNLNRRGVDVTKNDILITPGQILPPPELRGFLTDAAVDGDRLVQHFGRSRKGSEPVRLAPPEPDATNYVYFGGGQIRFGKLTMNDADLQLIDLDPQDPFDFFPARYKAQLVAGYSKNTMADGLRTYLPDFDDLKAAAPRGLSLTPTARPRGHQEQPPEKAARHSGQGG